jgi:ketosteroid isomerase-like protein
MRWAYGRVNEGRPDAVLGLFSDDVTLEFPGTSRWSRTYRGKGELRGFMQEVYELGLHFEVHDVLVKGMPWNMTIAVVLSDHTTDARTAIPYSNRAVEIWTARWGRVVAGELFEDTEKSAAWDRALTAAAASA